MISSEPDMDVPQKGKTITVDGQQYTLASLSEDAREYLYQLQVIDVEMTRLNALAGIYQTARIAYLRSFSASAAPVEKSEAEHR